MLRRLRRSAAPGEPTSDERLRALIGEHSTAVYRVALGIVRDPALAEDVTQETIISAWQALASHRGDASERSWILRIAHNSAVSTLRRIRDEATDPRLLPDRAVPDAEVHAAGRSDLAMLRSGLDSLDDLSRSIVILRDVENMSYAQIADALAVPISTVKTRLLRARRELQRVVEAGASL